ncbi:MAG: coenzyme F420-0:L-glutamate ligase [Pseudomonadota bacterium]
MPTIRARTTACCCCPRIPTARHRRWAKRSSGGRSVGRGDHQRQSRPGLAQRHGGARRWAPAACRRWSILRGRPDLFNRARSRPPRSGFADEIAAAASLLMGQADEGRPIVLMRGLAAERRGGTPARS